MFKYSPFSTIFLVLFTLTAIHANDDINKIVTYHSAEYGLHYVHTMNPKETVYSLSKFSGASVKEIYDINRLPSSSILAIGQKLIIPVHAEAVITDSHIANQHKQSLVKVMYRVKKKDNLFQIAKRHFSTNINTIVERNQLSGLTISPDQVLHIGWISVDKSLPVRFNQIDDQLATSQTVKTTHGSISEQTYDTTSRIEEQKSQSIHKEGQLVQGGHSKSTASQVVNEAVVAVNTPSENHIESMTETPKYRVVQHTPLHKNNKETSPTVAASESTPIPVNQSTAATPSLETSSAELHAAPTTSSTPIVETKESPDSSPTVTTVRTASSTSTETKAETIKNRDYPDLSFLSSPNLVTTKGVAVWDKNDNEPLNMFILHQDAKIGSYIRIENPMLGRIVLAKVVARLPTNVYDQDVKMVVSSAVASSLGVKDSRFLAEMKYIRL